MADLRETSAEHSENSSDSANSEANFMSSLSSSTARQKAGFMAAVGRGSSLCLSAKGR